MTDQNRHATAAQPGVAQRPPAARPRAGFQHGSQHGKGRLAATAALLAATAVAAAGCGAGSPASTRESAASASPPAAARPATPAASAVASPVASASAPAADTTYLAESQDLRGTIARAPACEHGCPLSGDGTIVLYDMTWPTWTGARAVGRGTEAIESCDPNCAAGGQYKVAVTVTLRDPVRDCTPQGVLWLWTRASFTWPGGLPGALHGQAAPVNPWPFTALKGELSASCA